jgi:hypothetical protein
MNPIEGAFVADRKPVVAAVVICFGMRAKHVVSPIHYAVQKWLGFFAIVTPASRSVSKAFMEMSP